MNPALRDYALLWSAATASRDPHARWLFRFVALVLPLIVGLLSWARTGELAEALNYAARAPVAVYLFAALTYYVPGAIRMNTPANARLVPRMRRRLLELTMLVWAGSVAAALLLAWGTPAPALLAAGATFTWLVSLGLASAGYQLGTYIQTAVLCLIVFRQYLPGIVVDQTVAAGLGLLLLALAALTLDLMFPNGGDRHWERRRAQVRVIERATSEGMLRQASRARFGGSYVAALRRSSTARRAPAFMLAALGPAMHWTQRYLPLLAAAAVALAAVAAIRLFASATEFAGGWVIGMCQAMLFAQLFTYEQRGQRLADTRTEQSLLRMAPSITAKAHPFNRQLNGSLLRMAVLDWAALVVVLLGIAAFAGANWQQLQLQAQICCLTLPLVAVNVRDHARASRSGVLRLLGWLAAALAVSIGAGALAHALGGTPVLPVAALASIVLAVVVALWRWRAAVAAPHAFPVGRLA